MISKAARVPRLCLLCRFSHLIQRGTIVGSQALLLPNQFNRRNYASNSRSGRAKSSRKPRNQKPVDAFEALFKQHRVHEHEGKSRGRSNLKLPDWGDLKNRDRDTPKPTTEYTLKDTSEDKLESPWEVTPATRPICEELDSGLNGEGKVNSSKELDQASKDAIDEDEAMFDLDLDSTHAPARGSRVKESLGGPRQPTSNDAALPLIPEQSSEQSEKDSSTAPQQPPVPRPNTRGFRHDLLHDQVLNVSALGKPASAIIIKNPNEMRRKKRVTKVLEEKTLDANMSLDWERFVSKDQAGDGELAEVFANIDEMRPQDTNILRMNDYRKLIDALVNGFTTTQLVQYLRDHDTGSSTDRQESLNYSWITKQIPWTPNASFGSDSYTPKPMYAQRILSTKWNIQIQDFLDDLGRAYVWIDRDLFQLITQGSNPVIDSLRKEFLLEANQESISTTSEELRINITARKASTYALLERLDETFRRIQRQTTPKISFNPSDLELQEVSRVTNTVVKAPKGQKLPCLEVSWLPESSMLERVTVKEGTESPADIVFRLMPLPQNKGLTRGLRPRLTTTPPLESSTEAPPLLIDSRREARSLSWIFRLRNWTRFVQPASKDPESEQSPLPLATAASLPSAPQTYHGTKAVTTATFGHIIQDASGKRILSPFIPHPATFSSLKTDNDEPLVQSTSIILNFKTRDGRGPMLHLRLPVNSKANLSDFSLPENASFEAVVLRHGDDLCLTNRSVDVQLAHHLVTSVDIDQPALREFLAKSEFNLLAGRLRTPSEATFSIQEDLLDPTFRGKKGKRKNMVVADIRYLFQGLEIHQTVEMAWRGHTLRYSSIEAGQHGGSRQEITLQFGRSNRFRADEPTDVFRDEARTDFLECVEDIATGKVFSWDEGYKAMKEKQFEDYSYDLPSEELGEDFEVTEMSEDDIKKDIELSRQQSINDELGLVEEDEAGDEELDDIFGDNDLERDSRSRLTKQEEDALDREIDAMLNLNAHIQAAKDKKNELKQAEKAQNNETKETALADAILDKLDRDNVSEDAKKLDDDLSKNFEESREKEEDAGTYIPFADETAKPAPIEESSASKSEQETESLAQEAVEPVSDEETKPAAGEDIKLAKSEDIKGVPENTTPAHEESIEPPAKEDIKTTLVPELSELPEEISAKDEPEKLDEASMKVEAVEEQERGPKADASRDSDANKDSAEEKEKK